MEQSRFAIREAFKTGNGGVASPNMVTITESCPVHPISSVTETVYVVVTVGPARGFPKLGLSSPSIGSHSYFKAPVPPDPVGVPPSVIGWPMHVSLSIPASAATTGLSEIVWEVELPWHPFESVTVTL